MILIGTFLLMLPISNTTSEFNSFLDSLFNATSSVCITGLTTIDISKEYTLFGQIVVLLLVQIGGLGYITMASLILFLIGKKISYKNQLIASEVYQTTSVETAVNLIKKVVYTTLIIEAIGFILLLFVFVPDFKGKGIFYSLFYSVSSFCNAGFDILPNGISIYTNHIFFNMIVIVLVILGGLGFIVLLDIYKKKLSFHSKVVLTLTLFIICFQTLIYATIKDFTFMNSLFLAVNTRTAGYSMNSLVNLKDGYKLIIISSMFIGASPASMAGGIKVTTLFVIMAFLINTLKNNKEVTTFRNSISLSIIKKSLMIFTLSVFVIFIATTILCFSEKSSLDLILFEVSSAIGTVGLSCGVSSNLSVLGKIVLTLLMFIGRVGILSIGMVFSKGNKPSIKYKEAELMVG